MELKNKKIYFLGDSITAGAGASSEENKYINIFKNLSGASVFNLGVSGTRIGVQKTPTLDFPSYDENFLIRAEKIKNDADFIVVFGGTNDWGHGDIPLGELTDKTNNTFSGCLNILCQYLIGKFSKDKLLFLTPLKRFDEENLLGEGKKKEPSSNLFDYVSQIKKIVAFYDIALLDLYQQCFPTPTTKEPSNFFADGTHPNDVGHGIIARKIFEFLLNK